MKSIALRLFLPTLIMLGLAGTAQAQELKIAVLDVNGALANSNAAQQIETQIMTETASDREKAQSLARELQELEQRMQRDEATLSDAEKQRIVDEHDELGVQYNYLVQKLQTLSQQRTQQFQQAYTPTLIQAIQEVVEQEGYNLVLRADAVLHFDNSTDITAKVIQRLNEL